MKNVKEDRRNKKAKGLNAIESSTPCESISPLIVTGFALVMENLESHGI